MHTDWFTISDEPNSLIITIWKNRQEFRIWFLRKVTTEPFDARVVTINLDGPHNDEKRNYFLAE